MNKDRLWDRRGRFFDDVANLNDRGWRLAKALREAGEGPAAAGVERVCAALHAAETAVAEAFRAEEGRVSIDEAVQRG